MLSTDEITIRRAKAGDEGEIANIHINSWREAYRGLLPQTMLDELPLTFKRRQTMWQKAIQENKSVIYVAQSNYGIIGFACFSETKEEFFKGYFEVNAIYLLEKFKGKGIGFSLLKHGLQSALALGFSKAFCWVLEDNPTIKFYEKSGAIYTGQEKLDEIGGKKVIEKAFAWSDLESFR